MVESCSSHDMSVPDMTALEHLDEKSMLENLSARLVREKQPYTFVSTVLVAVNPLHEIQMPPDSLFVDKPFDPTNPHPNALAELAFVRLCGRDSPNQSLVVSGESGAGKTETSKIIVKYLTGRGGGSENDLASRVVSISPVLEAFGNASTRRNPNSSRFGRLLKLVFEHPRGMLKGGVLETYLLEKSRVVRQNAGERNFHSFHMMLEHRRGKLPETQLPRFPRLDSGDDASIPTFDAVKSAMEAIGIDEQEEVWNVLAAVACLASVEVGSSQDANSREEVATIDPSSEALATAEKLLNTKGFAHIITTRTVSTRDETLQVPRSRSDGVAARDAACRWIYGALFENLVGECNKALLREDSTTNDKFVGILDIFGFETLDCNGLETLLINYANEALQQLFCDAVFKAELDLYESEGILLDGLRDLKPPDSKPTLQLIAGKGPQGPPGILRMLDAQCATGQHGEEAKRDAIFLSNVGREHGRNLAKTKAQDRRHLFHVKHYAGVVGYTVVRKQEDDGWVLTNIDAVPDGLEQIITESSHPFVSGLFKRGEKDDEPTTPPASSASASKAHAHHRRRGGNRTVSSRFVSSMTSLSHTLSATDCGFIRCVKPTPKMVPGVFEDEYVAEQLRSLGIVQATEVLRVGLPHRVNYDHLLKLMPASAVAVFENAPNDLVVACVLQAFEVPADAYKLGATRVFFPASALASINEALAFDPNQDPERAEIISKRLVQAKKTAEAASKLLETVRTQVARARAASHAAGTSLADVPSEEVDSRAAEAVPAAEEAAEKARNAETAARAANDKASELSSPSGDDDAAVAAREAVEIAQAKAKAATEHAEAASKAADRVSSASKSVLEVKTLLDAAKSKVVMVQDESRAVERISFKAEAAARRLALEESNSGEDEIKKHADSAEATLAEIENDKKTILELWASPVDEMRDALAIVRDQLESAEIDAEAAIEASAQARELVALHKDKKKEKLPVEEVVAAVSTAEALDEASSPAPTQTSSASGDQQTKLPEDEDADDEEDDEDAAAIMMDQPTTRGPLTREPSAMLDDRLSSRVHRLKRWFILERLWENSNKPKIITKKGANKAILNQAGPPQDIIDPNSPASLRDMVYRGLNTVPLDVALPDDPRHPLLHCIVKRKALGDSYQFEMYLSQEPTKMILCARRPASGSSNYIIYDQTPHTFAGLGKAKSRVVARLKESSSVLDATEPPSKSAAAAAAKGELGVFGQERPNGSMPRELCVMLSPEDQGVRNLAPIALKQTVPVMVQRDPVIRDGMYLLNFRGRGRVASGKNFQLVLANKEMPFSTIDHADDAAVVMQFCKVSGTRFHLDFAAPLTPLTSFALAVSVCIG